jgi:uncharacterized glyoxalase superfamily protein PhnB
VNPAGSHPSKTPAAARRIVAGMTDQTIFPALRYRDAPAAIEWLGRAFGFEPRMVVDGPDGTVAHAELAYDGALIMLGSTRPPDADDYSAKVPSPGGTSLYVVVGDPDAHHERARAAGAEVVRALEDTDYGSREYSARDPEGNVWSFGTYRPGAS